MTDGNSVDGSDVPDTTKTKGSLADDTPRFRKPERRKEVALAKFYGLGDDGEWEIEEIAEYLNVGESAVRNYIYDSELGERAREMFPDAVARTKMDVLMNLRERLNQVREIRRDLMKRKDVIPTGYVLDENTAEVSFENIDGMDKPMGEDSPSNYISLEVPVVDSFDEVTDFDDELQAVLREERMIEDEIREFLSLDEPDEVETSHTGDAVVEQKIYTATDVGGNLPDQEVVEVDAQDAKPPDNDDLPDAVVEDE